MNNIYILIVNNKNVNIYILIVNNINIYMLIVINIYIYMLIHVVNNINIYIYVDSESEMFNMLESIAKSSSPKTPVLRASISKVLEPEIIGDEVSIQVVSVLHVLWEPCMYMYCGNPACIVGSLHVYVSWEPCMYRGSPFWNCIVHPSINTIVLMG